MKLGNIADHCRCTATAKATGKRCRCMAAKGQKICRVHGATGLKPSWAKQLRMAARLRGERPPGWND